MIDCPAKCWLCKIVVHTRIVDNHRFLLCVYTVQASRRQPEHPKWQTHSRMYVYGEKRNFSHPPAAVCVCGSLNNDSRFCFTVEFRKRKENNATHTLNKDVQSKFIIFGEASDSLRLHIKMHWLEIRWQCTKCKNEQPQRAANVNSRVLNALCEQEHYFFRSRRNTPRKKRNKNA